MFSYLFSFGQWSSLKLQLDKAQQYQHIGIMEQTIGNDYVSETDANVENLMNKKNNVTKSNKCNQCDYASSYASALKTHSKMHIGDKPM